MVKDIRGAASDIPPLSRLLEGSAERAGSYGDQTTTSAATPTARLVRNTSLASDAAGGTFTRPARQPSRRLTRERR